MHWFVARYFCVRKRIDVLYKTQWLFPIFKFWVSLQITLSLHRNAEKRKSINASMILCWRKPYRTGIKLSWSVFTCNKCQSSQSTSSHLNKNTKKEKLIINPNELIKPVCTAKNDSFNTWKFCISLENNNIHEHKKLLLPRPQQNK